MAGQTEMAYAVEDTETEAGLRPFLVDEEQAPGPIVHQSLINAGGRAVDGGGSRLGIIVMELEPPPGQMRQHPFQGSRRPYLKGSRPPEELLGQGELLPGHQDCPFLLFSSSMSQLTKDLTCSLPWGVSSS